MLQYLGYSDHALLGIVSLESMKFYYFIKVCDLNFDDK